MQTLEGKNINNAGINGLRELSDFCKTELGLGPNQEFIDLMLNPGAVIFLDCVCV